MTKQKIDDERGVIYRAGVAIEIDNFQILVIIKEIKDFITILYLYLYLLNIV